MKADIESLNSHQEKMKDLFNQKLDGQKKLLDEMSKLYEKSETTIAEKAQEATDMTKKL